MSNETILMMHPTFGVLGVLAAVWVFVETLNARDGNVGRIRTASLAVTGFIWAAYLVGGYWYVTLYGPDKELIKAGPWPFAHGFFMETKEHVFLVMLLIATYLPIAAFGNLVASAGARRLVLWTAALVVLNGLAMEGAGAVVSMGVKVALLAKTGI
jgi:hypothetical protein